MTKRHWLILSATLLVLASVVGFWVHRTDLRSRIVFGSLPPTPELSDAAPMLRSRIDELSEQLNRRQHEVAALAELSRLYHANGFLPEAAQCYTGLEQLDASEPRWFYRHAMILAGYGDVEPALPLFERAADLAPKYVPARLRLADAWLKLNQPQHAAPIYEQILKQDSQAVYALLGLARLDWEAGRLEKARDRLEVLVQQTQYQLGYDLIVEVYERLGQRDRAEAIRGAKRASGAYRDPADPWLDELMEDCFDPYRLSLAGGAADRNGDMATGVRLLERAAQLATNDVSPRFQLGGIYAQRGDHRAALALFKQCTELAPDFADGWAFLSDALSQLGDEAGGTRAVLAGLEHCPESPGLHLMHGRQLRKGGQREAAVEEFKISIRLRPNEADAQIELGNTLIELGRTDEGIEQIKNSLNAEPENPKALGILAYNAITRGNEPEARSWMTHVRNQPRTPKNQVDQLKAAYRQAFGHEP